MKSVQLLPIDESGMPPSGITLCPDMVKTNCEAMAAFYKQVGFEPPWIGYVSISDGRPVGGGAFKGAPQDNRTEIAYYTLPEQGGRGFASATARGLIGIARTASPNIILTAQTLPTPNASNALLQKLGFAFVGTVGHPEDGEVWEWQLDAQQGVLK